MDAVKFLDEIHRLCSTTDCEEGCPLYVQTIELCVLETPDSVRWKNTEKIVSAVEKWSAEHPVKTRLQDFMEKYPRACLEENGMPYHYPVILGYCGDPVQRCTKCEHRFDRIELCWNLPLEE